MGKYGKLTLKISDFRFKKKTLMDNVEIVAWNIMNSGAQVFAHAAEKRIPVWTGMSKGGLLGKVTDTDGSQKWAEDLIGVVDSPKSINILSARAARRSAGARIFTKEGGHRLPRLNTGEIKNKDAGAKRAGYIYKKTANSMQFLFWYNIPQWQIHENGTWNSPTAPWHAIEVGKKAFDAYASKATKKAMYKIKLKDYMEVRVRTERSKGTYKDVNKDSRRQVLTQAEWLAKEARRREWGA
jgi:hypothetical protein